MWFNQNKTSDWINNKQTNNQAKLGPPAPNNNNNMFLSGNLI